MKEVIYNYDNLKDNEIDEIVIRCKGLIINDNNEIMLGYSHNTYQFPGGHLEENETLVDCLKREINEETGIILEDNEINKNIIEKNTHYTRNYHNTNKNRKNEIYYYIIKTNKTFNMNNSHLDKNEIDGNYTIKIINLNNVEKVLIDSIPLNKINEIIVEEMLDVIKEYKKRYMIGTKL